MSILLVDTCWGRRLCDTVELYPNGDVKLVTLASPYWNEHCVSMSLSNMVKATEVELYDNDHRDINMSDLFFPEEVIC